MSTEGKLRVEVDGTPKAVASRFLMHSSPTEVEAGDNIKSTARGRFRTVSLEIPMVTSDHPTAVLWYRTDTNSLCIRLNDGTVKSVVFS